MRVLCDADIFVFRCAFAAEYQVWFLRVGDTTHECRYKKEALALLDELLPGKYSRQEGEDYELWSERQLEPLDHALQNLRTLVSSILNTLSASVFDVLMCLSPTDGSNFRNKVAETRPYKGNRDRSHRPTYEIDLRNYIIENYDTRIAVGEEADDLLGILQYEDQKNTVIVTLDKDLDQIPGPKFNFMYDRFYEVTPAQGNYNFHMQLLTGDTTDNIPGLPGIGPGKAAKALHGITDEREQLEEVWRMYQIHSGADDPWKYLVEQGQLLRIRHWVDELWTPPEKLGKGTEAWNSQNLTLY